MSLKPPVILVSLLGFASGSLAGWQYHLRSANNLPDPAERGREGKMEIVSGGRSGEETGLLSAWQKLETRGDRGLTRLLARADLVSRATAAEIPRLLELAVGDPAARELLLCRWAELDPAGAADWLIPSKPNGKSFSNDEDVSILFSAWAKRDPIAALAKLRANAPAGQDRFWTGTILNRLLDEDMAAGVRFGGLSGSTATLGGMIYRPASGKWVEKDPLQAAALLSTLPPGEFRDRHLIAAIYFLGKKDLLAAIALQEQYPQLNKGGPDSEIRGEFYAAWAAKDLTAVTAFLNGKASPRDRPAIKAAIAVAMAEKDPQAGLAWSAANLNGRQRTETTKAILANLTRESPEAALTWLDSLSAGTALSSAVEIFGNCLPDAYDLGAALLAKAESLPDGAARSALTAKAYGEMYEQNPEAMLKNLSLQPAGSLPEDIWAQLGEKNGTIAEGMKLVETMPSEAAVEFVRGMFQANINPNDSLAKFTEAMSTLTVPDQRAAAIEVGVRRNLWRDPAAVADWAKALPPAERVLVADQIVKHAWGMTAAQKKEWVEPLR